MWTRKKVRKKSKRNLASECLANYGNFDNFFKRTEGKEAFQINHIRYTHCANNP